MRISKAMLALMLTSGLASSLPSTAIAEEVEFLHWWTSKGELEALSIIEESFDKTPHRLRSDPIVGGGGAAAKTTLQFRAIAGNPPHMALMEGPAISSWAALGFLVDLDEVAAQQNWDTLLYSDIRNINRYKQNYVAIPMNIHRLNWMWINHDVLAQHKVEIPSDWESLIQGLEKLKQAGVKPIALGNDQWQIVQLFENIAFGVGGPDYYVDAFVNLNPEALNSDTTKQVFERFRQISQIAGSPLPTMRWDEGVEALMRGDHAFQFTGDWALGEILYHHNDVPKHIRCAPFPSTESGFIYNSDSLVFFRHFDSKRPSGMDVVSELSSPEFLLELNRRKGSIPAQKNIPIDSLSSCQKQSYADYQKAIEKGAAIPSIVDSMAVDPIVQNAVASELYRYFSDDSVQPDTVVVRLMGIRVRTP